VFVGLGIQHAMGTRHFVSSMQWASAMLSSVACTALQYILLYLTNRTIFEKKTVFEHKMCVLIFSTTFV